jgi:hypothetical protein
MDLAKFISLLQTSSLYFCRADFLGDPLEGSITTPMFEDARNTLAELAKEAKEQGSGDLPEDWEEKVRAHQTDVRRGHLNTTFVNCWHLNEAESAAMWKLHSSSTESISIQSRFDLLCAQLPEKCYVGKVNYKDYSTDQFESGNFLAPCIHKRISFEHEREVRAVMLQFEELHGPEAVSRQKAGGFSVPVDLGLLIETIRVNPESPKWLFDIVQNLVSKYALKIPVLQSDLNTSALF